MAIKDTRAASFRIDSDKWLAFIDKAKENNTDSSKLLREWIDNYLDDGGENLTQSAIDEDAIRAIVRTEVEEKMMTMQQQQSSTNDEVISSEVISLKERLDELEKKFLVTVKTA